MATSSSLSKVSASDREVPTSLADVVDTLLRLDEESARHALLKRCCNLFPLDELLPFLKSESERFQNVDVRHSLRLAEALIFAAETSGQPYHGAMGLLAKGDALGCSGRYADCVTTLDAAGEAFLECDSDEGWARTRLWWVVATHRLGHGEAALDTAQRARAILSRRGVAIRVAGLDLNTAYICTELGRFAEALALYDRAQAIFESLGAPAERRVAWTKTDKALLLTRMGDFATALRLHEDAREVYARLGDTISVLRQEQNIALVDAGRGHYSRALRRFGDVCAALERLGHDVDVGWVGLDMVECYLGLNRHANALALAEETVARFERAGSLTEAAKARFLSSLSLARLGDPDQALTQLEEAGRAFTAAGLTARLGAVLLQRATMHMGEGDLIAAQQEAAQAHTIFAQRGSVVHQAEADLTRARVALELGDSALAEERALAVLAVAEDRDIRWLMHSGHHIIARAAEQRGKIEEALAALDRAMASIERLQRTLTNELRTTFLEDKLPIYEDAIEVSLRLGRQEHAYASLERAKSRALVDYLASNLDVQIRARSGGSKELLASLIRLREEHNWFYSQLNGFGASMIDADNTRRDDDYLRSAIRDRETQITRLLDRLALDRDEAESLLPDQAFPVQPTLPRLDVGTVLLEYYFGKHTNVVFVVTADGLAVVPLAVRSQELQQLLQRWRLNLGAAARCAASKSHLERLGHNTRGILTALYQALLAPVAERLEGHRVIVVPYGPTHAVPFHALHDGRRYLIEWAEVTVSPSSHLLQLCSQRPPHAGRGATVVAHSDGGRLSAVIEEAHAVAALLPGECYLEEAATRGALIAAAPRHSVLHIAAHGEARLDNPTFAHIKLADGQFGVADVFNLDLGGALITLSACETGRPLVAAGDELIGLSRGFLHAGAATLVQSLWRVDDQATSSLMKHFYQALCAGRSKGAALRDAQLALLGDQGAHPYYWAPFQLVGDGGQLRHSGFGGIP